MNYQGGEFDIFDYRKFQIDLQQKYGDIVCFYYVYTNNVINKPIKPLRFAGE